MYAGTRSDPLVPELLSVSDPSAADPPVWIVSPSEAAVWLGGVSVEDEDQLAMIAAITQAAHDLVEGPRGTLTRGNCFRSREIRVGAPDDASGHILLPGGAVSSEGLAVTDAGDDVDSDDYELVRIGEYETHLVVDDPGDYEVSYTAGSTAPAAVGLAVRTVIARVWADRAALVDPALRSELRAMLEPWAAGSDWG